jgi:hypothetical protein
VGRLLPTQSHHRRALCQDAALRPSPRPRRSDKAQHRCRRRWRRARPPRRREPRQPDWRQRHLKRLGRRRLLRGVDVVHVLRCGLLCSASLPPPRPADLLLFFALTDQFCLRICTAENGDISAALQCQVRPLSTSCTTRSSLTHAFASLLPSTSSTSWAASLSCPAITPTTRSPRAKERPRSHRASTPSPTARPAPSSSCTPAPLPTALPTRLATARRHRRRSRPLRRPTAVRLCPLPWQPGSEVLV